MILNSDLKGVADVMQSSHKKIIVNYCDVQWQTEGCDCGLFVINFATSLCSGENSSELHYTITKTPSAKMSQKQSSSNHSKHTNP